MTFPAEADAGSSVGGVDGGVSPARGHACSPGLEVGVDFERGLADDQRICDLAAFDCCSEVDHPERDLTDGTRAGHVAALPLSPDGAGLEMVG